MTPALKNRTPAPLTRRAMMTALALGSTRFWYPTAVRSQGMPAVRIAVLPIDAAAEPYYAKAMGFFAHNGLDATIQVVRESTMAPAITPGDFDFGYATIDTLANIHTKGAPLVVIAAAAEYDTAINSHASALIVPASSTVRSARDLNGKTIATNALHSLSDNGPKAWIDQNGGDSATVKFVELPFPAMPAAIAAGRVDAAQIAEPFVAVAKEAGRVLTYGYDAIGKRFLISGWVATPQFIKANPDVVRRFVATIHQTGEWANVNQAQSAKLLINFAKLDPAILPRLTRARYAERLTAAALQPLVNIAAKYDGFAPYAASDLVYAQ